MNTQEFVESLVEDGLDNNTIIDYVETQHKEIESLRARLDKITDVIFGKGAPLGSEEYFAIRNLALVKYA